MEQLDFVVQNGKCSQTNPKDFFPGEAHDRKKEREQAISVCKGGDALGVCPCITECLEYALDNNEEFGVWGGTTEDERRRIKRMRRDSIAHIPY